MPLTIDYLAHQRHAIPQLARWSYAEWRRVYDELGMSFDDVLAAHSHRANTDTLPLAVVAIKDGAVIGTGTLKSHDLPPRPDLTPWLGGIYVSAEHRREGVASAIIGRLIDEARRLRLPHLYLWTNSAAPLYAKLGWKETERVEYSGKWIQVMVRELG